MNSKEFKYLIRSKSLSFGLNLRDKSHNLKSYRWNKKEVFYRSSSSDMDLIYQILLKSNHKAEYFFPLQVKPKIIFDIGANIGITSIFLAKLFPNACIYSFEPLIDNFEVLKKNTYEYKNIEVFNFGLGSNNGSFKVYLSEDVENFGGVSFFPKKKGHKSESYTMCEVKNTNDVIKELGITFIDLIKIDTEGAEYDILTSLNNKILQNISWITGELHGNRDFELLDYLDSLGFSVSFKKLINNKLFMFSAGKKEIIDQLTRKEVRIL